LDTVSLIQTPLRDLAKYYRRDNNPQEQRTIEQYPHTSGNDADGGEWLPSDGVRILLDLRETDQTHNESGNSGEWPKAKNASEQTDESNDHRGDRESLIWPLPLPNGHGCWWRLRAEAASEVFHQEQPTRQGLGMNAATIESLVQKVAAAPLSAGYADPNLGLPAVKTLQSELFRRQNRRLSTSPYTLSCIVSSTSWWISPEWGPTVMTG
jgi:hypothetical protein